MHRDKVKSIVFDLGGVIINLDAQSSYNALKARSKYPEKVDAIFREHMGFFFDYERGLINDSEFRDGLRAYFGIEGSDEEIDADWNRMLLDIPPERIELLKSIRPHSIPIHQKKLP